MEKKSIFARILVSGIFVNLLAMAIVAVVLIALLMYSLELYTKHDEAVTVPNIKGVQVEAANKVLKNIGFKSEVSDSIYLIDGVAGSILEQSPSAQSKVKKGRTIYLTIQSKSPQLVPLPRLEDLSQRQALAQLTSLGFTNVRVRTVPSYYAGVVIRLNFEGDSIGTGVRLPKGSPLELIVGGGGVTPPNDDEREEAEETEDNLSIDQSLMN